MPEKLMYVSTCATNDPTKATIPFVLALGANTAGIEVEIALLGEATYLMKGDVATTVHGVGFPPLTELLPQVFEAGIPIHVRGACSVARGVTQNDFEGKNARFIDSIMFSQKVMECRTVTF